MYVKIDNHTLTQHNLMCDCQKSYYMKNLEKVKNLAQRS